MLDSPWTNKPAIAVGILLLLPLIQVFMAAWSSKSLSVLFFAFMPSSVAQDVDLSWYPPRQRDLNNLTAVMDGEGVYGFIYDTSDTPNSEYGTYNWCNMPHVRRSEYIKPPAEYELRYVELIHRHHKRTPYASNAFPVEPYHWDCNDEGLFFYGKPFNGKGHEPAPAYWKNYISPVNPFVPPGWVGTCQFPQITADGLDDSWQHGRDLYEVYHDLHGLLPDREEAGVGWRAKAAYRVTQNVITSEVAGMVISGMWGAARVDVPLLVQAQGADSLEPQYPCPAGAALLDAVRSPRGDAAWARHLDAAAELFASLDAASGVDPADAGFHASLDHYYDNLSARECHAKPLPCRPAGGGGEAGPRAACVTRRMADAVYRLGQWEYSRAYRDVEASLAGAAGTLGVWVAELAAHLRGVVEGRGGPEVVYFHNVAHDGSVSRLLAVLQADEMVWPGMGAEVVFELYEKKKKIGGEAAPGSGGSGFYVRVLFGGRVFKSSSPSLGVMEMLPVEKLLAYFDGLVGENAGLVKGKCNGSIPL